MKKARENKKLLASIIVIIMLVEMALISSFIDLIKRYKWAKNNANFNAVKKLGIISIKKYWKYGS